MVGFWLFIGNKNLLLLKRSILIIISIYFYYKWAVQQHNFRAFFKQTRTHFLFVMVQILARALLQCHQQSAESGGRFALEVFQSGRNRLENDGAKALAEVFEVRTTPSIT